MWFLQVVTPRSFYSVHHHQSWNCEDDDVESNENNDTEDTSYCQDGFL